MQSALPAFWRLIRSIWVGTARDNLGLIAAGVAFYGLLALFPAIATALALAGLFFDPEIVASEFQDLSVVLPDQAAAIVMSQAQAVARSADQGLGLAALFALGVAIYAATRGVGSLMQGLNVAMRLHETRGFFALTATKLALTFLAIVGALVAGFVSVVIPAALTFIGIGDDLAFVVSGLSWAALLSLSFLGLELLFRFGPCHRNPRWRWVTPGTALALLLWLAGSVGFAFYVTNFASYNQTFGTLGGVVILLVWLWLSAFVVLLGARIDTEIQRLGRG